MSLKRNIPHCISDHMLQFGPSSSGTKKSGRYIVKKALCSLFSIPL